MALLFYDNDIMRNVANLKNKQTESLEILQSMFSNKDSHMRFNKIFGPIVSGDAYRLMSIVCYFLLAFLSWHKYLLTASAIYWTPLQTMQTAM